MQKTKVFNLNDRFGNSITVEDNVIHIKVEGDQRKRKIGTVYPEQRMLVVERVRARHEFRKAQAYGFNWYILQHAKNFDMVKLCDDYGIYIIPRTDILENGSFLHFKKSGFERQIFMKISEIYKYQDVGQHGKS